MARIRPAGSMRGGSCAAHGTAGSLTCAPARPSRRRRGGERPTRAGSRTDGSRSMTEIIDAAAHPFPRNPDDIRAYMQEPLAHLRFPGLDGYFYPAPEEEYAADLAPGDGLPGSDPAMAGPHLLDGPGARAAILLPLTRGLLPDLDMASEVCAGTNAWLPDQWLGHDPRPF